MVSNDDNNKVKHTKHTMRCLDKARQSESLAWLFAVSINLNIECAAK